MKFVFTPISVITGLLAGILGRKIFERLWGFIDDEEPPLAFEGAIFRLVKGLVDHGARRTFAGATGSWPGEEAPQSD